METPDTLNYLFFAYTFIWLVLAAYIYLLSKRLANLEDKLNK